MGGKTSNKAKSDWKKRNYVQLQFYMDKNDGIAFKEKCKRENISQAEILRASAYDFLGKPVPPSKAKF